MVDRYIHKLNLSEVSQVKLQIVRDFCVCARAFINKLLDAFFIFALVFFSSFVHCFIQTHTQILHSR